VITWNVILLELAFICWLHAVACLVKYLAIGAPSNYASPPCSQFPFSKPHVRAYLTDNSIGPLGLEHSWDVDLFVILAIYTTRSLEVMSEDDAFAVFPRDGSEWTTCPSPVHSIQSLPFTIIVYFATPS
jgi:hypothetical protein